MTCDQLLHLYFTRETSRHFSTPASSECQLSPFLNSIATALLQFYNSGMVICWQGAALELFSTGSENFPSNCRVFGGTFLSI